MVANHGTLYTHVKFCEAQMALLEFTNHWYTMLYVIPHKLFTRKYHKVYA